MSIYEPRAATDHLLWANGSVTANFYVPTVNMDYPDPENRLGGWHRFTDLYNTFPGDWAHHTIDRQQTVSDVVLRVARAAEGGAEQLIKYPEWQMTCAETAAYVMDLAHAPITRFDVLSVQLPTIRPKVKQGTTQALLHRITGQLPDPPSATEVAAAHAEAKDLLERLQASDEEIRPLTDQELQWFQYFCTTFGGQEVPYTHPMFDTAEPGLWTMQPLSGATLNDVKPRPRDHIVLDTEAVSDPFIANHPAWVDPSRGTTQAGLNAVRDAITLPDYEVRGSREGSQRVFQAYLIVSKFPGQWDYPDYSLRAVADTLPFPTRISALGNVIENKAAERSLNNTFKHTEWTKQESAHDPIPDNRTEAASEAAHAEQQALNDHNGPSLPTTIVVGVGADSRELLEQRVNLLTDRFKAANIVLDRPKGLQTAIWHALHPGAPVHPAIHSYRRHMHARDVAGLGLWHGHELGDESGRLYGVQASTTANSSPRLVFRDVRRGLKASEGNQGATAIAIGEPGSGKTTERKEDGHQTTATGGGIYIFDRSPEREWERVSAAWAIKPTVIDLARGNTVVDLLRIHTHNLAVQEDIRKDQLAAAEQSATAFLAAELDLPDEDDDRYYALRAAVQLAVSGKVHDFEPSMPTVLRILEHWTGTAGETITHRDGTPHEELTRRTGGRLEAAEAVLERMKGLRESATMGESLFGNGPVLDLTAPAIIFSAPGLNFDNKRDRGRLYLATAIPLAFLPATERFNYVILPELAGLVAQQRGEQLVDHIQRLARRVYGGLGGDTQMPRDVPNDDMVVFRSVSRVGNKKGAQLAALQWMDLPTTAALRKTVATMPSGYKFIRDYKGRVGCVQMLFPLNPDRAWLTRTDAGRLNDDGSLMTFDQMNAALPPAPDGTVYDKGSLTPQHPQFDEDEDETPWEDAPKFVQAATITREDDSATGTRSGSDTHDTSGD